MIAIQSSRTRFQCSIRIERSRLFQVEIIMVLEQNDLDLSRVRNNVARQIHARYATRVMTGIYHLVQPSGQHTLCGLRISRVTSERKTNTLQLVNGLSANLTICKHCERIRGQESPDV